MKHRNLVLALSGMTLGSLWFGFGVLLLIRGPRGAPLTAFGLAGVVFGLLAVAASIGIAAMGGAWLQDALRVGRVNVAPVEAAERRRTAVLIVLSGLGTSCFVLGAMLVGTTFFSTAGLLAMLVGLLLMICGVLLGVFRGQLTDPETAGPKSGDEKGASRGWRMLGNVGGGILALLAGVSVLVYIGWFQYSLRPKPDTVGYAEFNTKTHTLRFDLPANWRISYYSRIPPQFYQGRITDDHGRPRLRAYGGFLSEDLAEYRRRRIEAYDKAGTPPEWSEYRETPGGRWWVYAVRLDEGDGFLGDSPAWDVRYRSSRGVHLEFTMPVAAAAELEPLTWRLVQSAEVRAAR
jgi:MFS family permease